MWERSEKLKHFWQINNFKIAFPTNNNLDIKKRIIIPEQKKNKDSGSCDSFYIGRIYRNSSTSINEHKQEFINIKGESNYTKYLIEES